MDDPRTEQLKTPVLYGGIYDPEATLACKGKVGEEVTITFGAKFDTTTTQPITATGTVKAYVEKWKKTSIPCDIALFSSCPFAIASKATFNVSSSVYVSV